MVTVEGGTNKQRALVEDAAYFAWKYLMPRISNCDVQISLNSVEGACGWCFESDDRCYEIELDTKLSGDDLLTAVFHEMVHVKQMVRKQFDMDVAYKTHEEYINLPWEVEAYNIQEVILNEWKLENNIEK